MAGLWPEGLEHDEFKLIQHPLIPANAGTQIVNHDTWGRASSDYHRQRLSSLAAFSDLGPGIRRDERSYVG